MVERDLRHDEHVAVAELLGSEHLLQVRRNLAVGVGGDAVEHDRERRAPLPRGAQELPRDGIGVAGGRRDEEPAVGGREQLVREGAVLGEHGVDVRRVEQRETLRQSGRRDKLERAGCRRRR